MMMMVVVVMMMMMINAALEYFDTRQTVSLSFTQNGNAIFVCVFTV